MIENKDSKVKKKSGILLKLRNYFTTGLLVLAPTAVTIWILVQVFRWFDNILGRWYTQLFEYLEFNKTHLPGLGAVTLVILVTLIGLLARHYAGRKVLDIWEKIIICDHNLSFLIYFTTII